MSRKVAFSTALEKSHVITGSDDHRFYGYAARLDSTAPSGTYYVQSLDAASLPSNGAVTFLCGSVKVIHTQGRDDFVELDFGESDDLSVKAVAGIVLALSTTEFTLTISGDYLCISGLVYES